MQCRIPKKSCYISPWIGILGSSPTKKFRSLKCSRYFVTFMDDYSPYFCIYLIGNPRYFTSSIYGLLQDKGTESKLKWVRFLFESINHGEIERYIWCSWKKKGKIWLRCFDDWCQNILSNSFVEPLISTKW